MPKIKKSELKSQIEKLQNQLQTLTEKISILETKTTNIVNPLQLPLFKEAASHCPQCNNDLSKSSVCMSVNCPYTYKVTCNA
jgi:hypothetical protein